MANTKDFIVKNAVEVGGDTKVTVGTAAAATLGPEGVFDTTLYTGTEASSQTITNGIDLSTDGGLVWVKARDSAINNVLMDTEQGVGKFLNSNQNYAQQTNSEGIKSFNTDGFTFGTQTGVGWSNDHVYWTFKKEAKFFDVQTFTYTSGSATTINHSLNCEVGMVIIKRLDSTSNWIVQHRSNTGTDSAGRLNDTIAFNSPSGGSNFIATFGTTSLTTVTNQLSGNYIAYLFAHDTSADSNIKCGSFTAGSSTETTVDLGWKPQWLMIKVVSTTGDWRILDSERGIGDGTYDYYLRANTADAETGPASIADLTNTGFKVNYGGANQDYVYIAIRESANTANLDLSTGNYFSHTPTSDLQYTFSNPADVQSFQLEVTGNQSVVGFDLANASYDSTFFYVGSQETLPRDLRFKPDGTKMYVIGTSGDDINEYSLSTAWDVSTASYTTVGSVSTQASDPQGLAFKPDGTKVYVIDKGSLYIYQYSLSTAWDISTISYDSKSLFVNVYQGTPLCVFFKSDGTEVYVGGGTGSNFDQFTLSTAWDISTGSHTGASTSILSATGEPEPEGLYITPDGLNLFTCGLNVDRIWKFDLTTAWDITTLTTSGYVEFNHSAQEGAIRGLDFKPDGTKMYIVGQSEDDVFQYSTGTTNAITVTWSSAIQWPSGTAPDSPAAGEKDIYTFMTDDTGTSYIGFQSGDAFS